MKWDSAEANVIIHAVEYIRVVGSAKLIGRQDCSHWRSIVRSNGVIGIPAEGREGGSGVYGRNELLVVGCWLLVVGKTCAGAGRANNQQLTPTTGFLDMST